jgi:hypothetical protein
MQLCKIPQGLYCIEIAIIISWKFVFYKNQVGKGEGMEIAVSKK